jgi:hypothetical protein
LELFNHHFSNGWKCCCVPQTRAVKLRFWRDPVRDHTAFLHVEQTLHNPVAEGEFMIAGEFGQDRHNIQQQVVQLGKDVVLICLFLKSAGASTFTKATADKPPPACPP